MNRRVVPDVLVVLESRQARLREDLPPAQAVDVGRREEGGEKEPERRNEPEQPDEDEEEVHRRLAGDADDLGGKALLDDGRPTDLGCRGGHYTSLRKRRILSARIGITRTKRKTAIAEPRPKSLTPPNDVRHIASAITFASSCTDCGATAMTMSNTLSTLMRSVMNTTESTGARSGTVTRRKTCHSVAPSVRAASRTSRGIAARPAAMTTMAKPAQIQM